MKMPSKFPIEVGHLAFAFFSQTVRVILFYCFPLNRQYIKCEPFIYLFFMFICIHQARATNKIIEDWAGCECDKFHLSRVKIKEKSYSNLWDRIDIKVSIFQSMLDGNGREVPNKSAEVCYEMTSIPSRI